MEYIYENPKLRQGNIYSLKFITQRGLSGILTLTKTPPRTSRAELSDGITCFSLATWGAWLALLVRLLQVSSCLTSTVVRDEACAQVRILWVANDS